MNGFVLADKALKDGVGDDGYYFMGMYHYVSNSHASGHLFGGVRGLFHLGILRATNGQIVIDQEPSVPEGALSGTAVVTRMDWEFASWYLHEAVLYDILVSG